MLALQVEVLTQLASRLLFLDVRNARRGVSHEPNERSTPPRPVRGRRGVFGEALPKQEYRALKFPCIKLSRLRWLSPALDQMNIHALCGVAVAAKKNQVVSWYQFTTNCGYK